MRMWVKYRAGAHPPTGFAWIYGLGSGLHSNARPEVELKVEPVDPRSLFRGDYVILTYAISDLNTSALEGDDDFSRGDRIFVELILVGGQWQPVAIFRDKPATNSTVVIAGTVDSAYPAAKTMPRAGNSADNPLSGTDLNISYGWRATLCPKVRAEI